MDAKLVVAVDSTQVKKADDDLNKLAATAAKVESEISDLGAAGAAAAKGMSAMGGAAGGSVQQLTQAERIMQRAGLTAGQYSQAMGLLPAQLTDVVTSLASGMPVWLVAIQQGGQIKDSFNGIGNAARAVAGAVPPVALGLTAVGAAAVTAAVGLAKGEAETSAFNRAIILTGNAAGTTADQLRGMAIALGGSATEGAAAAALAEIAATGKIAADQIQAVATAALSMEQTTGKAVSDTVKEFVRLADEPAAASAKLNEQYNYLTTSVYEQIKALEDQGRTTEAAKLATDTYAEAIRERSGQVIENLGYVESAWNAIVGVTKRATDAIREFGRDQTISDQIADIDAKLTDAYSNMATAYSDADKAATQGYINRLNAQKTALQLSQNEANLQAGIDSLRAERTKQEIADAQARDRALSGINNSLEAQLQSAQRLTVEERTRQQLTKAGVDLDSAAAKTQLEKARQVDAASAAAKSAAEAEREGEKAKRASAAADKKRAEEIQRVLDTLLPMEAAERKHAEQLAVLDSLVSSGDLSWQEYQVAVQNAWATLNKVEFDKAAQEMRKGEQEAKRLAAELQSIEDRLDPLGAAARKYQQEQAKLNAAIAKGGPEADKYRATLTKLEAEYAENQRAVTAWGKWTESALERVDSAFADAWMNIGEGFKGFRDSLTNAFKQMLAELAHMAITRPIVMQIGAALGIGGGTQGNNGIWGSLLGGGGGSGGGGIGSILQAVNTGRSVFSAYSTAQSIWPIISGGYANGGIGGAVGGVGSYLGTFLGGSGAAASTAAGSTAAGYSGAAFNSWLAAQSAGTGAAASAGPGALSGVASLASNPFTWILAGMFGSSKAYDAGARLEVGDFSSSKTVQGLSALSLGGLFGRSKLGTFASPLFGPLAIAGETVAAVNKLLGDSKLSNILTGASLLASLTSAVDGALFGGPMKLKHQGVAVRAVDGEFRGNNYQFFKAKKGLFGGGGEQYHYSAMNADLEAALSRRFDETVSRVPDLFEKLGFDVAAGALDGLNVGIRHIALAGGEKKQQEQLEKGFSKWLGKVGNVATADIGSALVSSFADSITQATGSALGEALQQAGVQLSEKQLSQVEGLSGKKLSAKLSSMKVNGEKLSSVVAESIASDVDAARAAALEAVTTLDAEAAEALSGKKGRQLDKALAQITGFGKNAYETLSELVGKLDTVNATFEMLNLSLYEGSLAGSKMAEDVIALAGGMDAFAESTAVYYDKFFSSTEKAEDSLQATILAFSEVGLALPSTREGFRDLVESIDVATESGRELFNTLMGLAGAADAAYNAFSALRSNSANMLEAAAQQADAMVSAAASSVTAAYQREASELTATISVFDRFVVSLRSFRSELSGLVLASASPTEQVDTLRQRFEATATKARLGDQGALEALPGVGKELASASLSFSTSREDYVRDLARMQQAALAAEETAGRQKGIAEQQLDKLTEQVEALGLINTSVQSLSDAMKAYAEAQKAAEQLMKDTAAAARAAELEWISGMMMKGFEALKPTQVVSALGLGFDVLDANTDKLLNNEELKLALKDKASDEQIKALGYVVDSNFDGLISATEMAAAASLSQAQAITAGLAGVQNAIGSAITLAQAQAGIGGIAGAGDISNQFGQLDTNKDGLLGADEIAGTAPEPVKKSVEMTKSELLASAKAAGIKTSGYQTLAGTIRIAEALAEKTGTAITTNSSKSGKGKTVQAGFAYGGYTGPGGKFDMAGVVHAGEVVWSQEDIKRWGGWQSVDAMRKSRPEEFNAPRLYLSQPSTNSEIGQQSAVMNGIHFAIGSLQDGIRAIAKYTMQTAKRTEAIERFMDNWDVDGLPRERMA